MIVAKQVKAARVLIDFSQDDLADAAKLSIPTVQRMEASKGPVRGNAVNVWQLQKALEGCGYRVHRRLQRQRPRRTATPRRHAHKAYRPGTSQVVSACRLSALAAPLFWKNEEKRGKARMTKLGTVETAETRRTESLPRLIWLIPAGVGKEPRSEPAAEKRPKGDK